MVPVPPASSVRLPAVTAFRTIPSVLFVKLTADSFSQQLAYMKYNQGKIIPPHVHHEIKRDVFVTQEVLFIKKGKLRVDFYTLERDYIESYFLEPGDVILLASGGHGFEVIEDLEMFEVKQGPYKSDMGKTSFAAVAIEKIILKK